MIDCALARIVGAGICLVGLFAIYFFIALPLFNHRLPEAEEIVLALGIFSIGVSAVIQTYFRTRSTFWFALANLSFWFFLYSAIFYAKRMMLGASPSWHGLIHASVTLALTIVFSRLAISNRKWKKPNA
jgi:hypothetical protein